MTKKRLFGKVETLKLIFLLFFAVLLLLNTKTVGVATEKGIRLCYSVIIPSLFPFFILSRMISPILVEINNEKRGIFTKLFHISPSGRSALLLGLLSGFPIGAKEVASLYRSEDITKEEACRLLSFCNNTGPAFVIGTVGTLFHSLPFGVFLYLLQIFIASMTGIALGVGKKENSAKKLFSKQKNEKNPSFSEIVLDSGVSVLKVCTFIVAFQILLGILSSLIKDPFLSAFFASLFEIGSAISAAEEILSLSPSIAASLAAFSISFSGFSVFMQSEAFLKEAELSILPTVPIKLLQGLLSAIITFFASPLFF